MKIEFQDTEKINQDLKDINNPLEPLKVASALNSEIMKFNFRKGNKPGDISPLDYTIMVALSRQIPAVPVRKREPKIRYTDGYTCPSCGGGFSGTGIADYCYHCGQRLKWEGNINEKSM